MYELYSMTRTGKPRLALIATALLLVISTAMAAFVAHQRSTASVIQLRPPESYGKLGLQVQLPANWEVGSPERIANGHVLVAKESVSESPRQLIVFQVQPTSLGAGRAILRERMVEAILQIALNDDKIQLQLAAPSSGMLGALQSDIHPLLLLSSSEPNRRVGFANLAVGPDRHVVGVILLDEEAITRRDATLLDQVSQSVQLPPARQRVTPTEPGESPGRPEA